MSSVKLTIIHRYISTYTYNLCAHHRILITLSHSSGHLFSLSNILECVIWNVGPVLTAEHLLPLVLQLTSDVVPNVRFNAVRALGGLVVSAQIQRLVVIPRLQNLLKDSDSDVSFHAETSLKQVNDRAVSTSENAANSEEEAKVLTVLVPLAQSAVKRHPGVLPRAQPRAAFGMS